MHLSRVDLNLLVVFDTVYSEGGITAASRKLHLSQPAVSHALARLRELFGEPLFERHGRGVVPTPLARSIAGPVRAALASMQRTLLEAGRFEPAHAERGFRIGLREALEPAVLPPLARSLLAAGPGIHLATARHDRARLRQDLAAGEFDLVLDVLLPALEATPHERVFVDRLVVVGRRHHPALRRKRGSSGAPLDLDTYLALQHVSVSSRRRGLTQEDFVLGRLGRQRNVRLRCQSYVAACALAAATDLVVTLPERYARQIVKAEDSRIVPVPIAGLVLETYMYWTESAAADAANVWLREQVQRAFGARPAGRAGDAPSRPAR